MNTNLLLYKIAGNTISQYLFFIAYIAGIILILNLFRILGFSRIKKLADSTDPNIGEIAEVSFKKNIIPMMYIAAIYMSTGSLNLNNGFEQWLKYLFILSFGFFITRFSVSMIIFFTDRFWIDKEEKDGRGSISALLNTVIKIIIWSISILILLDNIGIKISGLIAGLGVGGVAIAFAAQSILRDIFNYFTIFFDRPFEIGDFLVVDKFSGTVEHIGIKTTRLRSTGGEQLIFSNTDLTGSRVRNYKGMEERKVVFSFGVKYQTSVSKLKNISGGIEKIIECVETARFDRAHFFKFGETSLDFEVAYYVLSGDYRTYMDVQQEINLKIMALLEKFKVELWFHKKYPAVIPE